MRARSWTPVERKAMKDMAPKDRKYVSYLHVHQLIESKADLLRSFHADVIVRKAVSYRSSVAFEAVIK